MHYVPGPGDDWERIEPRDAGLDGPALQAAIDFHRAHETPWGRDLHGAIQAHFEPPPWNEILGPVRERGEPNGIILRHGRIVAEWGDTRRVDMTFSASKSYVSTCAGLAFDDGLIPDLDEPVRERVRDGNFDTAQNAPITWAHLLQQTGEWEGTLWDKPDLVDRNRSLATESQKNTPKGTHRDLQRPGTYWEYNDVRVNLLALAVLRVVKRPLPELLKARIMDPIGASDSWEWHGYRNSSVTIDGREMQSVSGGGHWGGGLFVGTRDHARFGELMLRRGKWGDRQLLSENWIDRALTPCERNPSYGFMWWLNTGRQRFPSAPASSFAALGAGYNMVYVDPEHDLVAVARWIDKEQIDGFLRLVLAALS